MKILFVYAEFEKGGFKPISISLLSSLLKEKNHDVKLFDTSLYSIPIKGRINDIEIAEQLALFPHTKLPVVTQKTINKHFVEAFNETINGYEPDLVAFTSTTLPFIIVKRLIEGMNIKKRPALAIGGTHVLHCLQEVKEMGCFDYICFGEGEKTIIPIINHLSRNISSLEIPNTFVKDNNNCYITNERMPLISDLDELPYYDWSIYEEYHFWRPYQGNAYKMGDFQTSRGCPYGCLFCFHSKFYDIYKEKKKVRFYSPKRCVDEMAELSKLYKINFWKMHDSDFFLRSDNQFIKLMENYKKFINLPFVCNANANSISIAKAQAAKNAGCRSISLGVESGNQRLRKEVLGKNTSNESIFEAVAILKDVGIRVCTSNMLGFPEETEEDIRKTINFNRKANVDLAEPTFFFPFKGTVLGDYCYEKGYIKESLSNELINLRMNYYMNMPQIKRKTIINLMKTFPLYMNLPQYLDPIIQVAERDDDTGNEIFILLNKVVQNLINIKNKK